MRNSRVVIVGSILVILAGLAAWKFLEPAAPAEQSTPSAVQASASADVSAAQATAPPETARAPLSQAVVDSASTSPPAAGARLDLRTIHACHDALVNKKALTDLNCDDIPAEETSRLNFCRNQQAEAAKQVNEAAASAASCPPELLNASAYYEAIKELALRGDIPAQRCFIQGYFASAAQEGEESRMRKDQLDEYPGMARKFIDEAFERGDWSVVRWLARMRTGLQDGMLRSAYPFGSEHPETFYRMNYLLMIGNQRNFEKRIDARQLVQTSKNTKTLAPMQLQEAEEWAQNMFDQHFNGSQEGASIPQFCEHS